MDDNDPFNFNILDHPTENLPSLDQVPEFNDTNDLEPFSFDPLPSPNPRLETPFPIQLVDHQQNPVIVDANSGAVLHDSNELPDDLAMLNADGSVRDLPNSQHHLERTQSPALHALEHEHVQAVQPQVEEVAPTPHRTPAKRKRRSKKTDNNKYSQQHPATLPTTMLHNTNVHVENSTDPSFQAGVTNVHGIHGMAAATQPNGQVEMNSVNASIPPSQVNVTHVSHITAPAGSAPVPQAPVDTPGNQYVANQGAPSQVQPQPQQDGTKLNDQLIPPASPLGRLPVHLQDLLMNQARHRSYTVAEVRAADMAQNAAARIHSMIHTGEIVLNVSTPNQPRFIIPPQQVQQHASHPNTPRGNVPPHEMQHVGTQPPPKVRRTRSKTSSRAQYMRTPPRPSPTPQMVAVRPQTPATRRKMVAPTSVPSTPVFSNVTRLPSQDLSHASSADFRSNHLAVPHHPLTPVPTIDLEQMGVTKQPDVQGQASSPHVHPQQPVLSSHLATRSPALPRPLEENAHRPGENCDPVHPKTPVSAMHPKQPVSGKHPKSRVTPKQGKRQAPDHPERPGPTAEAHHYPPYMMDPMNGLSPGAGPSHIPVTARSTHIAEVAAQAMAATFHEMEMMQASAAAAAPAEPGGGSNLAGPSNATHEQTLAANGFPVPPVPQHPGYPQPQASVPPAVIAAHRRAKNTYGVKLRFTRNAKPSKYCHICGRSSLTVRITDCANLRIGLCRKVLCEKCLIIYDPFYYDWSQTEDPRWLCLHCRRFCPDNARCATYTINNQKRKEKNEEMKREKKKKKKLLEEKQKELKRRNDDRRDDPGDSPTGVADNNVF